MTTRSVHALAILIGAALLGCSSGPKLPPPPPATSATRPTASPVVRASLHGTLVYSAETSDGGDDVFSLTLPSGRPVRLTDGPEKEFDPSLSPDGSKIAYRRNPDPKSDAAEIWLMDLDGSNPHALTTDATESNWAPTWMADGRIAWTSMRGGDGILELWTMTDQGASARRVSEGWCEYAQPSPDGTEFVCAAATGGHYDIVIVDAATGARRPLTRTLTTEFGPSWSPDGDWITFSRDLGERWALLRIHPDGSGEEEVASEGVFSTWDPDGHLVWSGIGGIHVANPDGTGGVVIDEPGMFVSWR